jgi:hypothetical protein
VNLVSYPGAYRESEYVKPPMWTVVKQWSYHRVPRKCGRVVTLALDDLLSSSVTVSQSSALAYGLTRDEGRGKNDYCGMC